MQYPERAPAHILETASWRIFSSAIPDEWILRQVTERDYGIDCYLELVGKDRRLAGHMASVQLKTTQRLKWRSGQSAAMVAVRRVRTKTLSYWLGLQTPVFLCLVDQEEKGVYFADVKRQLRRRYIELHSKDSVGIEVPKAFKLNTTEGAYVFYALGE